VEPVTKELIKSEIDRVGDENLAVLYRVVRSLEEPVSPAGSPSFRDEAQWHRFLDEVYGSMAEAPIDRGDQGEYDVRLPFE
jgi:hypothetical protein